MVKENVEKLQSLVNDSYHAYKCWNTLPNRSH